MYRDFYTLLGPKFPPPDCPCQDLIRVRDESTQSFKSSSNSFKSDCPVMFPTHGAPAPPEPLQPGLVGLLGSKLAPLPPIFSPTPAQPRPPAIARPRRSVSVDATTFQVYLI